MGEDRGSEFDEMIDRRGTGSLKWDVPEGELPMWVADMDFRSAACVREAIRKRAEHGVYGYCVVPQEWRKAYVGWWRDRHGIQMEEDWLIFCSGVVPAISSVVRKLTDVGENVVVQTPVYDIFFHSIRNNGRNVLESPLLYDGMEYRMDFADLEAKLSDPQTTMMILCNPHNPIGKIWDRETLERVGELCARHQVTVVSDEIHCDVTRPGSGYVPFASLPSRLLGRAVICLSPSKAFNLAGIQTAAVAVPDAALRHKAWRGLNTDEVAEPNAFAVDAAIAAFTEGGPWLDRMREYVWENRRRAEEFLRESLPEIRAVASDATYLLWLDCGKVAEDSRPLSRHVRKATGLYVTAGAEYGSAGRPFLRMNLGCPRERLEDGLRRLAAGVRGYEEGGRT